MHPQESDGEALIALCGEMELEFVKKQKSTKRFILYFQW